MIDIKKGDVFKFLSVLRNSGETNMWGATPYIQEMFPVLSEHEAGEYLLQWMKMQSRERLGVPSIVNNPTLESNVTIIADWIVHDCDDTVDEVEWLLKKLFAEQVEWVKEEDHVRTLNEDIRVVYHSVFEYLIDKEGDSR